MSPHLARLAVASSLLALVVAAAPREPARLRVALLLAGPENDEGWNQSAYEGLQRIEKELGADVRKVTAKTATEIDHALDAAAQQGFQFVYGHGVEFNAPAAQAAAKWPAVSFATSGGEKSAKNLAVVDLRNEEAAYQLGILAAHLTKSQVLSSIHGERFQKVEHVAAAFARGARSVKKDVKVLEDYLGSWEDVALAKERALAHAAAGADVFFQNADAAGAGIFEACRERHALAFGCNRDQTRKAPDVIVASAVADVPDLLVALATEVRDAKFTGGQRSFGTKEGKVRVVFNGSLETRVPAEARKAMESAVAAIEKGELTFDDATKKAEPKSSK
jgi:basic membrane lipoprotein Med (substrate-binding protein (PBP1-ABC) superfamily)